VCGGQRVPCAFNPTGFSNFFGKFEKPHSVSKSFFDTLKNTLRVSQGVFGKVFEEQSADYLP